MTRKQVVEKLDLDDAYLKFSKGNFTIFRPFFYGGGKQDMMEQDLINSARKANVNIEIVDSGSHWHDFVGGAKPGSAKSSYDYVTFKVME